MTLAEFANLTQRQLLDLYAHPRDEEGNMDSPNAAEQMTDKEADALFRAMAEASGDPANVARVEETIRKREEARRGKQ